MSLDLPVRPGTTVLPRREPIARAALDEAALPAAFDELPSWLPRSAGAVCGLRDRRVARSGAVIGQLLVGPAGVFVVGTERVDGARVQVRRSGGLIGPRREQLVLAGRERTDLIHSLQGQVAAVRSLLAGSAWTDAPVTPLLCTLDARPFRPVVLRGVVIGGPQDCLGLLATQGPYDASARTELAGALDVRLAPLHG